MKVRTVNIEANRRAQAKYRAVHREAIRKRAREKYLRIKDKEQLRGAIYRAMHREELRAKGRISDANPERKRRKAELERSEARKATRRTWKNNNIKHYQAWRKEYETAYRERRAQLHHSKQANDPQYRIARSLRSNLKNAIKNQWRGGSAIKQLGCSVADLKKHLERQWSDGMDWHNFGRLNANYDTWQIDHIIPLSAFDLTDSSQLAKACHWTNLAPLWAIDNRRKANKTRGSQEVPNAYQ